MKTIITLTITLLLTTSSSFAQSNSVESRLPFIRNLVRTCAVQPYSYNVKSNNKVLHSLISHCPEVTVITPSQGLPQAMIKVGGLKFLATMQESESSDGDFFDITIREVGTTDSVKLGGVLAYADILLGILSGNTDGVPSQLLLPPATLN